MDANGRELILNGEVFEGVGCAMEVLNELDHDVGQMMKIYIRVHSRPFAVQKTGS